MTIASFSNKVFQVSSNLVRTFSNMQFSSSLETEKQDNPGGKPKTYIKGPDLSSFAIKVSANIDFGVNPRYEIGDWLRLKNSQKPYPFLVAGKPFGADKWLLKEVQVTDEQIDNNGNFLKATISLSFEEYALAGTASESKSAGKSASASLDSVYLMLAPEEKKELKPVAYSDWFNSERLS